MTVNGSRDQDAHPTGRQLQALPFGSFVVGKTPTRCEREIFGV